ncbi:MAG TPA: PilW family protein [Gammaproteobacteria bacterium]|nr:PilW family protein [Gammaproteobacteria bacterium]
MMRQKGFTLVEMMIAIVIGLLLIAGTLSVFISTKQGYRMTSGMSLMQATGRATLDLLTREIMISGFPQEDVIDTFVSALSSDGGGGSSDTFTVHYRVPPGGLDCLGNAAPVYADGQPYAKNQYFVQGGNLMCQPRAEDDSAIGAAAIVVAGIENLQILYGEDNDATDGILNATRYVTASNVANWANLVSAKIGIVVNSQNVIATTNDTTSFSLIGQTANAAAGDRLRRRAYSTTTVIRNRM